ncbi:pseudouridine synthase [Paracoccus contaminans]|uniref:pseudouridine synthase n=1 Tax=Paracoccus contaminans TaxID=1945662 RepID=UPI00197DF88C|nr:pseudouridine synthase [Paracoccus contaminans]
MTDPDETPGAVPAALPDADPAPEITPEAAAEYAEVYPDEDHGELPPPPDELTGRLPPEAQAAPPAGGERIAKVMARAGVASRREAERMIIEGRVTVNGAVITSPALDILPSDKVRIDGQPMDAPQETRLWMYYKPVGLVTSEADEKGRQTVFDALPRDMPRVMSIGRLDLNSEGLLLLTNDGALKRRLELPSTGWLRRYRVRVNGQPTELTFDPLRRGALIDGETFQPMEIKLDSQKGANAWLTVGIREGRNREIRRAMAHVGLTVNRLIRIAYGPFRLTGMEENEVREVKRRVLRDQLGGLLADEGEGEDAAPLARRPGARRDDRDQGRPPRGPRRADGESPGRQDRGGFERKPRGPRAEDERTARPYSARPGGARADRNDKAPFRDEARPARPARAEGFAARPPRPRGAKMRASARAAGMRAALAAIRTPRGIAPARRVAAALSASRVRPKAAITARACRMKAGMPASPALGRARTALPANRGLRAAMPPVRRARRAMSAGRGPTGRQARGVPGALVPSAAMGRAATARAAPRASRAGRARTAPPATRRGPNAGPAPPARGRAPLALRARGLSMPPEATMPVAPRAPIAPMRPRPSRAAIAAPAPPPGTAPDRGRVTGVTGGRASPADRAGGLASRRGRRGPAAPAGRGAPARTAREGRDAAWSCRIALCGIREGVSSSAEWFPRLARFSRAGLPWQGDRLRLDHRRLLFQCLSPPGELAHD